MAQRTTDDQPNVLPPALGSMPRLVAAVIVHDKATNRVVLLQRSQNAKYEWTGEPENRGSRKHAQVRWVDTDAIPEVFVDTTASALHCCLDSGPQVSLEGWE